MDVVKFHETLAKIIAQRENVHIKVHIERKESVESDNTDESPKGSVSCDSR